MNDRERRIEQAAKALFNSRFGGGWAFAGDPTKDEWRNHAIATLDAYESDPVLEPSLRDRLERVLERTTGTTAAFKADAVLDFLADNTQSGAVDRIVDTWGNRNGVKALLAAALDIPVERVKS